MYNGPIQRHVFVSHLSSGVSCSAAGQGHWINTTLCDAEIISIKNHSYAPFIYIRNKAWSLQNLWSRFGKRLTRCSIIVDFFCSYTPDSLQSLGLFLMHTWATIICIGVSHGWHRPPLLHGARMLSQLGEGRPESTMLTIVEVIVIRLVSPLHSYQRM